VLQRTRSNPNHIRILPRSNSSLRRWSGAALSRYLGKNEGKEKSSRARSQQHDEQRETERAEEMKKRRAQLQELLQRADSEYKGGRRPQ
jgi:hypothetical protein